MKDEPGFWMFLKDNGLSVVEFHVLNAFHYAAGPAERLILMAARESIGWRGRLPSASRSECEEAVASLLSRGLLQTVDESVIRGITKDIEASRVWTLMDPPELGELDLTLEGGRLWRRIATAFLDTGRPACFGYGKLNEDDGTFRTEYFGATEQAVRNCMAKDWHYFRSKVLSIEGPVPIGAWRASWWDVVHERGYRVIVVERPESAIEPSSNGE